MDVEMMVPAADGDENSPSLTIWDVSAGMRLDDPSACPSVGLVDLQPLGHEAIPTSPACAPPSTTFETSDAVGLSSTPFDVVSPWPPAKVAPMFGADRKRKLPHAEELPSITLDPRTGKLPDVAERWLSPREIQEILEQVEPDSVALSLEVPDKPASGTIVLYDRESVKFRKDGHNWKKRADGKNIREDHARLKVDGTAVIYSCYSHLEADASFHRRCYWLIKSTRIILVHYLRSEKPPRSSKASGRDTARAKAENDVKSPSKALCSKCNAKILSPQLEPFFSHSIPDPETKQRPSAESFTNAMGFDVNEHLLSTSGVLAHGLRNSDATASEVPIDFGSLLLEPEEILLRDFCPKESRLQGGQQVLVIGEFSFGFEYQCLFGEVAVPAQLVQNGVLTCTSPPAPGAARVRFLIRRSDGLCTKASHFVFSNPLASQVDCAAPLASSEANPMEAHSELNASLDGEEICDTATETTTSIAETDPSLIPVVERPCTDDAKHASGSTGFDPRRSRNAPHTLKDITWRDFLLEQNMAKLSISIGAADADEQRGASPEQQPSQDAARTIQQAYRRYIEALRGEKRAVAVIEGSYKRYREVKRENAAIKIQTRFRGHRQRKAFRESKEAAIIVQRFYRKHKFGDVAPPLPTETVAPMDRFVDSMHDNTHTPLDRDTYSVSPEEMAAARKILRFLKQCTRQERGSRMYK